MFLHCERSFKSRLNSMISNDFISWISGMWKIDIWLIPDTKKRPDIRWNPSTWISVFLPQPKGETRRTKRGEAFHMKMLTKILNYAILSPFQRVWCGPPPPSYASLTCANKFNKLNLRCFIDYVFWSYTFCKHFFINL